MHVRTLSSCEFEGEAPAMRIVISGGTVITASGGVPADVLVDGERIAALAAPGTAEAGSWAAGADRVLDATGRYVLPGGIDVHTHMEMPFGGTFSPDRSDGRG